jgi:ubiquinone biosynthesis protein
LAKVQKQWPEMVHHAADLPELLKTVLSQQAKGQAQVRMRSDELADLTKISQHNQRQLFCMVFGLMAGVSASVLYVFSNHHQWAIGLAGLGALAFAFAWPRKL